MDGGAWSGLLSRPPTPVFLGFPGGSAGKESAHNVGDLGLIPGWRRSSEEGQDYWGGLPFPTPGDLPNPGIKPRSPMLQVDSLPAEPPGKPKNTAVGSLSLL